MNKSLKLPFIVTLCHLPLLFLQINSIKPESLRKKRITVHTIHLTEKPSINIKKQNIQNPSIKNSISKKTPPHKKKLLKKRKQKKITKKNIQKAINKSLSKTKTHAKKIPKKKNSEKKIAKKDAGKTLKEYNTYLQEVSEILRDSLTLPEEGKVKLAITVRPKGKIVKIVSLSSESVDNLSYLQKHLVNLTLPKYKKNEERTFTIVFSDEK